MTDGEELLRPALELAVAVARAGAVAVPPVEPPRRVQRVLGFTQLPATALRSIRKALDEDEAFRARVADAAAHDEEGLGRPAWLFLTRPEGWADELAQLEATAAEVSAAGREEKDERTARRRLAGSESALRRAEEHLAGARAELAAVSAALAGERRARKQAEEELEALRPRASSLERERDAAHQRASAAAKEVARLQEELAVAAPPAAGPEGPPAPLGQAGDGPDPLANLDSVRLALREAAAAAARLDRALEAAAEAAGEPGEGGDPLPAPTAGRPPPAVTLLPAAGPSGRLPVALPPGLFAERPEVAEFLVRVPRLLLLVDGYNASLRRWPQLPIAEQRQRLVDALGGTMARTGGEVHVVFDGAGEQARSLAPRRGVRVTFSPVGVEADQVILDLVDHAPPDRPVAVASDDRRVRREAGARGANVLTQAQLFGLLGFEGLPGM